MLETSYLLPSPCDLRKALPLTIENELFISESRDTIRNILNGLDQRMLLIVGPCSIHDPMSAKQYALHLKELRDESFFIVMRVYFEKARTANGWKGILYDPHLDGSDDLVAGMEMTRQLLLDLAELEIPAAAEILDPFCVNYFSDLISWGCIGARTASSQIHRQMASSLNMPIGFKNNTDGNISQAINGIVTASAPHSCFGIDENGCIAQLKTLGNRDCHIVLRGGEHKPNYDAQSVMLAQSLLRSAGLPEQLIIDCSHGNCGRVHEHQRVVFQSVISQRVAGNQAIRGLILESHLHEGNQAIEAKNLRHGVSITDPCISWEMTEQLVRWGHTKLISQENECINSSDVLCIIE